jgi:GH24 family phage-related lysozyme (muramidase)
MAVNYGWLQKNIFNIIMDGVSSSTESSSEKNSTKKGGNEANQNKYTKISEIGTWSRSLDKISSTTPETWQSIATNFIATKEKFTEKAVFDVDHQRAGYGTDVKVTSKGLEKWKKNKKITLTKDDVKEVAPGTVFTKEEAKVTLEFFSVNDYGKQVAKDLGEANWNKLNNHQKAALVTWAYNVGKYVITAYGYGRKVKSAIAAGNYDEAALIISNNPWTADGKFLRGLKIRRTEEAQLFLYPSNKPITYK